MVHLNEALERARAGGPGAQHDKASQQVQSIGDEPKRSAYVERLREEYTAEIDILHLASEMVADAVIRLEDLRVSLSAALLCTPVARGSGLPGAIRLPRSEPYECSMAVTRTVRVPDGVSMLRVSPGLAPASPLPTGESIESDPPDGVASVADTSLKRISLPLFSSR